MTICLVVQKDTLENNKVKAILKIIEITPDAFVSNLQESHCYSFQLLAYTNSNPVLFDKLINAVAQYKTNLGKDWYEFDHEALSKIISFFLESDKTIVDFKLISSIYRFVFQLFPIVTKEVKLISSDGKEMQKEDFKKDELVILLENLNESELLPKRRKDTKKPSKKE